MKMNSDFLNDELVKNKTTKTSLVVQWLKILLPMQGTRVWSLVWEDPTCHGATRASVATNTEA